MVFGTKDPDALTCAFACAAATLGATLYAEATADEHTEGFETVRIKIHTRLYKKGYFIHVCNGLEGSLVDAAQLLGICESKANQRGR